MRATRSTSACSPTEFTDRDASLGRELLADVNPTFNWVRLAQRVPVRIHIDRKPEQLALVAGTTCTVVIHG